MTASRLLLLLGLLAPACQTPAADTAQMLEHAVLARAESGGPAQPACLTIRTAEGLRGFFEKHAGDGSPAPHVDFTTDMVVVIALGERPSAGYAISVEHVIVEGGFTRVLAREIAPDGAAASVVTQPYLALRMPRRAGPVTVSFD